MSNRVEFISYNGSAPNFCRGCFSCSIDGAPYSFGGENGAFDSFWDRDYDWGCCGDWGFYRDDFPSELADCFDEVVECFLLNVPELDGCCDGCR